MIRTGDTITASNWMTGDESPALIAEYEQQVREAIDYLCTTEGFNYSEVKFHRKHPMDEGVPDPPDHVQGSQVRLIVGEAEVLGPIIHTPVGSFVANLDKKDLKRLRKITRRKAPVVLTNAECDAVIEQIGPEAALDALRRESMN